MKIYIYSVHVKSQNQDVSMFVHLLIHFYDFVNPQIISLSPISVTILNSPKSQKEFDER